MTDDNLRNYVAEAGIKDAACRKLEDKNGVFRTAAFQASCSAKYRDLFYDESAWPEGAELRDWVMYSAVAMELQVNDSCGPVGSVGIVTYNAHGLNTGRSYLMDLCNDPCIFVIALQEHWPTPHNLSVLNSVHPEFMAYGVSAMGDRLKSGVFKGRPYGGVAFLWRRSIAAYVDIIQGSSDGRCLCMSLNLNDGSKIKLITVYFPCSDAGMNYVNELSSCLGFLESVIYTGEKVIVLGDINFACDESHKVFKLCREMFNPPCIFNCDALCSSADRVTYHSSSMGHSSFIDHFLCLTMFVA